MKIGIIGTRGIPNYYGGFEQFAEIVSKRLVGMGHDVHVYSSHNHPYQQKMLDGVHIIHCKDPEDKIGTAGQFIYDFNCIRDARKRKFDIILQLGYTSSSVWHRIMPKNAVVTTNMDGLEWKRTKFSKPVQRFIKYAERLAVKNSDFLISDSVGIQSYIRESYGKDSTFIPYGAELLHEKDVDTTVLEELNLEKYGYSLLIARLEPENNVETIIKAHLNARTETRLVVVGKTDTPLGQKLTREYGNNETVLFIGGFYDKNKLDNLRFFSNVYFHGHTVGGTNPSLLEAMASNALICAHQNEFNASVLGDDAFYFHSEDSLIPFIGKKKEDHQNYIKNNREKIEHNYSWERIANQYNEHFQSIIKK